MSHFHNIKAAINVCSLLDQLKLMSSIPTETGEVPTIPCNHAVSMKSYVILGLGRPGL